jgi:hypothetical protein
VEAGDGFTVTCCHRLSGAIRGQRSDRAC